MQKIHGSILTAVLTTMRRTLAESMSELVNSCAAGSEREPTGDGLRRPRAVSPSRFIEVGLIAQNHRLNRDVYAIHFKDRLKGLLVDWGNVNIHTDVVTLVLYFHGFDPPMCIN